MVTEKLHRTSRALRGQVCVAILAIAFLGMGCTTKGNDKLGPRSFPVNHIDDLWDFSSPASSEERFRAFMEASQDPEFRAEVMTQIARAQGLQNEFDAAHVTLDEAQALAPEDALEVQVRILLERGRVLNSAGKPAESRQYLLDALALAEGAGLDRHAVDAAHMMGIVEPPAEQIAWSEKALDIAMNSRDLLARRWLGPLYNNLGWSYHDTGNYEQALGMFENALEWYSEHGQPEQIRVARWSVARTLRSLGQVEEALEMQEALLEDLDAAGVTDGYVYEELGECLLALNRPDKAQEYFALAYRELSQDEWLLKSEPDRIARLKTLSEGANEQRRD